MSPEPSRLQWIEYRWVVALLHFVYNLWKIEKEKFCTGNMTLPLFLERGYPGKAGPPHVKKETILEKQKFL